MFLAPRLQLTVASDGIEHVASQRTKQDSKACTNTFGNDTRRTKFVEIKITTLHFDLRSILVKFSRLIWIRIYKHALNSIPSLATDNLSNFPDTFTADRGRSVRVTRVVNKDPITCSRGVHPRDDDPWPPLKKTHRPLEQREQIP